jgi:large subunit ribosomal protein L15
MLKLDNLSLRPGAKQNSKRVGRGTSSGVGKTCGRGHKGQKSRTGGTKGLRFEGGQTPLYRRLPKRGFKNYPFKKEYNVINIGTLNNYDGEVSKETLGLSGLLKILGNGELKKALKVKADKFSATAKKKIEAAGGQCLT